MDKALAEVMRLSNALRIYADPGFYRGIFILPDSPTGGFDLDMEPEGTVEEYPNGPGGKPGAAARKALDVEATDSCLVEFQHILAYVDMELEKRDLEREAASATTNVLNEQIDLLEKQQEAILSKISDLRKERANG